MNKNSNSDVDQPLDHMAQRKKDHIDLAFESRIHQSKIDPRFYYEPLLAPHPQKWDGPTTSIAGKELKIPIWISSMTGGTQWAKIINTNLAKACKNFGMGMGLGSCRPILFDDEYLADFAIRQYIGDNQPLFANLGIAQIEELLDQNKLSLLNDLVNKLEADGLIIHVNPFQEWLQPEGDRFKYPPLDTIKSVLDAINFPIIVKEVGQGMGIQSLRSLLELPLAAVDFAANGGTNFAKLELLRSDAVKQRIYAQLANIGHSAEDMVLLTNQIEREREENIQCRQIIISGGINSFLDGYFLIKKSTLPAIYGQASAFLQHARGDYEELHQFVQSQVEGLALAQAFLRIRP